jgi:hypothetical protein
MRELLLLLLLLLHRLLFMLFIRMLRRLLLHILTIVYEFATSSGLIDSRSRGHSQRRRLVQ